MSKSAILQRNIINRAQNTMWNEKPTTTSRKSKKKNRNRVNSVFCRKSYGRQQRESVAWSA
ncbi:hypothetical protein HYC85_030198 [Camellia sinensis]|uniref:Uncharacterized protein n=1 Tax=Camellia sinensis TaxID=4442 RepID=A0A7J7G0Q6_CAMSI|nr:hypothetical protein HYC85_030198 [Camellia sinensis]